MKWEWDGTDRHGIWLVRKLPSIKRTLSKIVTGEIDENNEYSSDSPLNCNTWWETDENSYVQVFQSKAVKTETDENKMRVVTKETDSKTQCKWHTDQNTTLSSLSNRLAGFNEKWRLWTARIFPLT